MGMINDNIMLDLSGKSEDFSSNAMFDLMKVP